MASTSTSSAITNLSDVYRCKYGETQKLNHINYEQWSLDMRNFLHCENAMEIVTRDEEAPAQAARALEYRQRQAKARAMLLNSCSPSTLTYVRNLRNPPDIWNTLRECCNTVA